MLTLLKIRNLALVDELVWELGPGLIGVTGETGAGKSDHRRRPQTGARRTGGQIPDPHRRGMPARSRPCSNSATRREINAILAEGGLEPCDDTQLIVRRVIGQTANRQFVNDSPVTLALLKRLGEHLVDLHGPHDHQSLLSTERQLAMLDAYAGADAGPCRLPRASIGMARQGRRTRRTPPRGKRQRTGTRTAPLPIQEIDAANLQPEDEQELEDRWRRASNATRLLESAAAATTALNGEDGILERLAEVQRLVRDLEKLDPSVREHTASLETAVLELQDLERNLADYAEELDIDPADAAALEERVNLLESLKRKYGPTLADVLARRDRAADRLDTIENRGEKLAALERELAACRAALDAAGKTLTAVRRKAAPKLAKEISGQLKDLGFQQASSKPRCAPSPNPAARASRPSNSSSARIPANRCCRCARSPRPAKSAASCSPSNPPSPIRTPRR